MDRTKLNCMACGHHEYWHSASESFGDAGCAKCECRDYLNPLTPPSERMKPFPGPASSRASSVKITWDGGSYVGRGTSGLAYEKVAWAALKDGVREFQVQAPTWKKPRPYRVTKAEAISYLLTRASFNYRSAARRLLEGRRESPDGTKAASGI